MQEKNCRGCIPANEDTTKLVLGASLRSRTPKVESRTLSPLLFRQVVCFALDKSALDAVPRVGRLGRDWHGIEKHAANGINPFTTPTVVDAGANLSRSISSVDEMVTITKTETIH